MGCPTVRKHLCGEPIGRADTYFGSGPWYVNLSRSSRSTPIVAEARTSSMWVQVSGNCTIGAEVSISNRSVITIDGVVPSKNGHDIAISILPVGAGHATLNVTERNQSPRVAQFTVTPVIPPVPPLTTKRLKNY
jgi:hypothetical protein